MSTVQILLDFSATLLHNATSKQLYQTTMTPWLAAADDRIAHTALDVLYAAALPVQLHKQPHPSHDTMTTTTTTPDPPVGRLVTITARGYGSAGTGTGLDWAVTADDAQPLPPGVGTVWCRYFDAHELEQTITADPMMHNSTSTTTTTTCPDADSSSGGSEKKRRKALLSTAELFCSLRKDDLVDPFCLLTEVRLARAAHAHDTRIAAVQRRLQAMTILLYTAPEVLHHYFLSSQPELMMELVRLLMVPSSHNDNKKKHTTKFAAMHVLSALVSRRDGRLSVLALQELGVAKGQYVGVLPTLLRSCLASLHTNNNTTATTTPTIVPDDPALTIGLSYVQAMYGGGDGINNNNTTSSRTTTADDASSFDEVEHILLLTSAVASSPTGIAALIECGLMTTLLAILECTTAPPYVVSQAVQMMESALVTHTHAVAAFTDLNGGKALMGRLEREVNVATTTTTTTTAAGTMVMIRKNNNNHGLIYTLLNCLTVYLHHDATALQTIADPLQKLLTHNTMVDGHILALVCNLISEITNNDPNVSSVVKFIHSSGLATAFLQLLEQQHQRLPRIPELFMSIPNILFALALTEDGATVVQQANPYPALLSIFTNPAYAMPQSRCLLNEMPSTIGASLEDIMRNVDSLKPYVFAAIVQGMQRVGQLGRELEQQLAATEEQRTCLIQYILNYGQLLEQVLQHDDHVEMFMNKGGFEALVELYAVSVPPPLSFVHQASSLSCPTISSLHHATTEDVLLQATKCLQFRYDSRKFLQRVTTIVTKYLDDWEQNYSSFSIQDIPNTAHVYNKTNKEALERTALQVSCIAHLQWATKLLTIAIRSGGPRNMETSGSSWSRSEKEWLKDLASDEFTSLIDRLGTVFLHCLRNVCQARAAMDYDDRDRQRMQRHNTRLRYRLRIVCSEGAVVRDGIDIDSCANVGSLEMGEIIVAFDRCINSSGILRYRTERGWVSEMTRGHGREPIAEVFQIYEASSDDDGDVTMEDTVTNQPKSSHKRVEADVPDLQTVMVGVLSRCQTVCSDLLGALSKIVLQSTRALSSPISLEKGGFGHGVASVLALMSRHFEQGFNLEGLREEVARIASGGAFDDDEQRAAHGGTAMYLGCLISQLQTLTFEDKRDPRRTANFPLLCAVASPSCSSSDDDVIDIFCAARCINEYTLRVLKHTESSGAELRVPRCVASSFPPLVAMLQRLASSTLSSSPTASVMSRMTRSVVGEFLGKDQVSDLCFPDGEKPTSSFHPEALLALIQLRVSDILRTLWSDFRLDSLPPHAMHPLACATGEIVVALEESNKKKGSARPVSDRMRLSEFMARRLGNPGRVQNNDDDDFEPNEDTIRRVAEMGFSRDHAIEAIYNTHTNDINVVMEHALTSLPPTAADIQRRRDALAARQRRREQRDAAAAAAEPVDEDTTPPVEEKTDTAAPESDNKSDENSTEERSLESVVNKELSEWFEHLPSAITTLLGRIQPRHANRCEADVSAPDKSEGLHHEVESLTILLSSLLFDLCTKRQDKDISVQVMSQLIRLLKFKFRREGDRICGAVEGAESSVAILCHATALMVRSVPLSRKLVLKEGVSSYISSAITSHLDNDAEATFFPVWFPPALLLLGIMAEPMAIFNDDKVDDEYFADPSTDSEIDAVKSEHNLQLELLRKAASDFHEKSSAPGGSTTRADQETSLNFSTFPTCFPLLSPTTEADCMKTCLRILESVSRESGPLLSPSLCQSILQLSYRLLRNPITAAEFAKTTFADCILSLPKNCKFQGSTGLVTMVLRRLVEDRSTLKSTMEAEIKGVILKYHAKNGESKSSAPSIPLKTLMDSVTPLLYREPSTFFQALVLSGNLKMGRSKDRSIVSLAPQPSKPEEPSINEKGANQPLHDSQRKLDDKVQKGKKAKQKPAAKTPKRQTTPKKSRKDDATKTSASPESAASRICSIVMSSILAWKSSDLSEEPFVPVSDLLDLLADLVLASPNCASAVHGFRVRGKDKGKKPLLATQIKHALAGCHPPQRSFVNFVLHVLLPQDLWSIKNDPESWGRSKSTETCDTASHKRKLAVATVKLAQASARMVLTLVARPGDIRKRVISDLAFALSGGMVNSSSGVSTDVSIEGIKSENAQEMHALNAWGELCYAIAAPRSSGKEIEGVSAVNMASVRLLLDNGMVHALLYAIKRIRLQHAMAWSTGGVLLLPLEILTRPAVSDAVISACRVGEGKDAERIASSELPDSSLPLQDSMALDDHLDNAALHDEYHPEDQMEDEGNHDGTASDELDAMSVESDDDSIIDGSSASSDSTDHDDDSDEDMSDAQESVDGGGEWDVQYDDPFAMDGEQDANDADETSDGSDPPQIDEDWTQIERQGLGGAVGQEPFLVRGARGGPHASARGYIDAAEAMISSLMRNGDISRETLAEIEGTLGIRIVNGGRLLGATAAAEANQEVAQNAFRLRVLGGDHGVATDTNVLPANNNNTAMPSIQQRNQPDVFHAAFSRSGQSGEVSPMECVFGGPSLTGGSTNYSIVDGRDRATDEEAPFPSQLVLLPSGPASVVRMRAQPTLHPLFSSLELPPSTSLVSDTVSPTERCNRRQNNSSRRLGDWTTSGAAAGGYFNSASGGARNRSFGNGTAPQQRHISGLVVWLDEGQLPQNSTERFLNTIQNMLDPMLPIEADATEEMQTTNNTETGESEAQPVENAAVDPDAARARDHNQRLPGSRAAIEQGFLEDVTSSLVAELRESLDVSGTVETTSPETAHAEQAPNDTANLSHERENPTPESANQETTIPDADRSSDGADLDADAAQGASADQHDSEAAQQNSERQGSESDGGTNAAGLTCPPGFDEDVFQSLPTEMQQDCINQYDATQRIAEQLDGSTLDPAVLAELPEDMRREVIEQDRQQRLLAQQEQAPADPSHAQEMDNASIIASMAPELREEILMTLDESVLSTLPPQIIAEAQILRERASVRQRRIYESVSGGEANRQETVSGQSNANAAEPRQDAVVAKKKAKSGKMKIDADRDEVVVLPEKMASPIAKADIKALLRFMFLLTPVKPPRILQRVLSNFCENKPMRNSVTAAFVWLLHSNGHAADSAIEDYGESYENTQSLHWRAHVDKAFAFEQQFPPARLFGAVPNVPDSDLCNMNLSPSFMRQRQGLGAAASAAGHLRQPNDAPHASAKTPPVVTGRVLETLIHMCRNTKFCLHLITHEVVPAQSIGSAVTCFGKLLDLLKESAYTTSSTTLEQLLFLLELCVYPLLHLGKQDDHENSSPPTEAEENGYADVPRIEVSTEQLQALCSTLRMESCRDAGFSKVNSIARRLCRVEANRSKVLAELAQVADRLGSDAYQDLRTLRIRMERVVSEHEHELEHAMAVDDDKGEPSKISSTLVGSISSSIALSTSTSELKLLRVLQTIQTLCNEGPEDGTGKKNDASTATPELVDLLGKLQLGLLWDELSSCLKVVQVLEGIKKLGDNPEEAKETENDDNGEAAEETDPKHKTLRNSAAGLLARFLPSVEAFFVANACVVKSAPSAEKVASVDQLVGGQRLLSFVSTNKVLLNALIRTNASLLDKGMRALVQIPQFRHLLDFDVKRNWFKTQVKRLRHQASRRYGSLRLQIRRGSIFQDAYFQLQPRNADEMRGRLNVTFRNEEGVDAGGLSREFFGILAKEMFNPNYALFVSTEDGITFQPNPNSMINPDHLSYFRFVGRVVGKALSDGYLLDAHFTRSLYKHMLGLEPTHHDMEAIDPDYYGNLRTILENSLEDMGLDHLTFSIEDHSFGRNQTMDLIPQGRTTKVTDENKEEYVRLVCQHRMTTSIKSQIKSYLDGFYELVSPELISIFNPRELELLISGLPDIDAHDLKENTEYVGWKAADREIGWFWNVIFGLSRNEKASFLQFVTGSSKVPLAGFAELQGMRGTQKFSIHKTGGPKGSLMSAHTCFNSLDLPTYESEEETRKKLLMAINEGGGAFGFA